MASIGNNFGNNDVKILRNFKLKFSRRRASEAYFAHVTRTLWIIMICSFLAWIPIMVQEKHVSVSNRGNGKVDRLCALLVMLDAKDFYTLGRLASNLWIPSLKIDIFFVLERGFRPRTDIVNNFLTVGVRFIYLPVQDTYPPLHKELMMWETVAQHLHYHLYVKIDSDTVVNVHKLHDDLSILLKKGIYNEAYIGVPSSGRKGDEGKLGIEGPYCLGPAYALTKPLLLKMLPWFKKHIPRSNHSDSEVGRIVNFASGLFCKSEVEGFRLFHFYYTFDALRKGCDLLTATVRGTQAVADTPLLNSQIKEYTFFHPVKSENNYINMVQTLKNDLRPLLPYPNDCHDHYRDHFRRDTCFHNPLQHFIKYGIEQNVSSLLPECPSKEENMEISLPDILQIKSFVLGRAGDIQSKIVLKNLKMIGFSNISIWDHIDGYSMSLTRDFDLQTLPRHLTPGEVGYLETVKNILKHSIKEDHPRILVFDNDLLIDKEYKLRLEMLLKDKRCLAHLWSKNSGGVLKLGGTMWNDGFKYADKEINTSKSQCYNHFRDSYGSYAWIAQRNTFEAMLTILESSNIPFDWVLTELVDKGYIVRTVYPNLFIMDVDHVSSIDPSRAPVTLDERQQKHRWNLRKYVPLYSINQINSDII